MSQIDFNSLQLLSKTKSESNIELIFNKYVDIQSMAITVPQYVINETKELFTGCVDDCEVIQMITSVSKLVYISVKNDLTIDSINGLFPQTFDKQLKQIIIKLIDKNSDKWLSKTRPIQSMPSLVDFECKTEANDCVIDWQTSGSDDVVVRQSLVFTKQQIQEMVKGMSVVRQQLFDATQRSD